MSAVRRGASLRAVARQFRVSLATVQRWVARASGQRLDRTSFADQRQRPRRAANRSAAEVETAVVQLRVELRDSILGECGADAIRAELERRHSPTSPSRRTVNRILERHGLLDHTTRIRRPAPPRGWYLPEVAAGRAELDSVDVVTDLFIHDVTPVEVLTVVSLHGGLSGAWQHSTITARFAVECLAQHWRLLGRPRYVQFDNDTRFQGPRQLPDTPGRVIRLALALGITPVFAPPRESGFQAAIENFNGQWQRRVWRSARHASLADLRQRSDAYIAAHRQRHALRIDAAPPRQPFTKLTRSNWPVLPSGQVICLRRTSDRGTVEALGHFFTVPISEHWNHRLVRVEFNWPDGPVRLYALRRRQPTVQPLLAEFPYRFPRRTHFKP